MLNWKEDFPPAPISAGLESFAAVMAEMTHLGKKDTPEYHEIFAEYQELSHLITEATKVLKAHEDQDAYARQEAQVETAHFDLSGINPIKGTLGPVGQPGALSRGPDIVNLQKFLSAVGYSVPANGEFEGRTRLAVQQFQTQYGLKCDGIVGAAMRKLVNELLQRQKGQAPQ